MYHFGSTNKVIVLGDYALSASSVFDNQFVDMFSAPGLAQMVMS